MKASATVAINVQVQPVPVAVTAVALKFLAGIVDFPFIPAFLLNHYQ